MKQFPMLLLAFLLMILPGCSAVEGIFKAGMWWAFFLVFIVIFGIAWLFFKRRK
ncbi:MAG TPA: hypothetical protein VMZ03_07940 [Chitinophagaceae bacterium]|nr:hypothetical protein [Chitinophagaceae bacterium]